MRVQPVATAPVAERPSRFRAWLRPPRQLRFTREGKLFVAVALGVGVAAINTGNNLLYLVLGMMLSLIVLSGILSEVVLRGLRITRRLPQRVHAGVPFLVEIVLANDKQSAPSYSVEIEDLIEGRPTEKRCYFLKVSARGSQTAAYRSTLTMRGLYRYRGLRVSSRFPFGLFEKSRRIELPAELIVYPKLVDVSAPPPAAARDGGEETMQRAGQGGDFFGLREYRAGDDSRNIHWTSTARTGVVLVREHHAEGQRRVAIVVDNALADDAGPEDVDRLEHAIRVAASFVVKFVGRGFEVQIVSRGETGPWGSPERGFHAPLRYLALLRSVRAADAVVFPSLDRRRDVVRANGASA